MALPLLTANVNDLHAQKPYYSRNISLYISITVELQLLASNLYSGLHQIWGKFGTYHQYCRISDHLNLSMGEFS